jgi:hypothetical protein
MAINLIEQLERRLALLKGPGAEEPDRRLGTEAIARRYGVCARTVKKWREDPNFPPPEVDPSGRRYNWLSDLNRWDRERRVA